MCSFLGIVKSYVILKFVETTVLCDITATMKAYFDGPTPNLAQRNNENNVDVYNVEEVSERYKDTMNDAHNHAKCKR